MERILSEVDPLFVGVRIGAGSFAPSPDAGSSPWRPARARERAPVRRGTGVRFRNLASRSRKSELAVTNRRALIEVGILSRHSVGLLLTKIEGIGVDQKLPGRLLGFCTIVVTGTGGTREAFAKISHPLRFRPKSSRASRR